MIGTTLGNYLITAKLGEGGMGEVWRATDPNLKREVAIKVLPAAFSEDKERLARFEREAQLLAQLHHPNIASIFGLELAGGARALVMELVEGPTLADRLSNGALPLEEALAIARQIAEALEAAHEKGIVHRDLKPQNIKVALDGTVKVLDFGLAKAMDLPAGSAADLGRSPTIMNSPTLTAAGTQLGVILGTAAYMAPEQARGSAVDKRADIWAFGVVLYEMLGGRSLFAGDTVSDTLAGVLKTEIDFASLPESVPASIRALLRRCLERNPKNRLRDIGDARLAIDEALAGRAETATGGPSVAVAPAGSRRRERIAWTLAALGLLTGLGAAWIARRPVVPLATTRFTVMPARSGLIDGYPAFSPDGRRIAYTLLETGGAGALWIHDLGSGEASLLAGTEGAQDPFWSPDGRFVAFFTHGQLRRIPGEGGTAQTVCAAGDSRGGTWGDQGDILFTQNSASGLFRVAATGGVPSRLDLNADPKAGHRFPWFLPGGKHFLFTTMRSPETDGIYWGSLDAKEARRIVPDVSMGAFDSRGYLIFVRQGTLMAQRFDPERGELSGEALAIDENVGADPQKTAKYFFGLSAQGALAVRTGLPSARQLLWFDRAGNKLGVVASSGGFSEPVLSADETRVVVSNIVEQARYGDLWIYDATGTDRGSRLTFGPASNETPVFSPDGARVAYSSPRSEGFALLAKATSGSGPEEELAIVDASAWADDWSRDGRFIVFERFGDAGSDLWLLAMDGHKLEPYLATPANEGHAAFSPDGRYVAYVSDESGSAEVYVQTVPISGSKWQVSTSGGDQPFWGTDGKTFYYLTLERKLIAVPVRSLEPFSLGEPEPLFTLPTPAIAPTGNRIHYAVTRDGQRILVNALLGGDSEPGIRVTLNWTPAMESK